MTFEAALVEPVHEAACDHLLAHLRSGKRQEDLCFALWRGQPGRKPYDRTDLGTGPSRSRRTDPPRRRQLRGRLPVSRHPRGV